MFLFINAVHSETTLNLKYTVCLVSRRIDFQLLLRSITIEALFVKNVFLSQTKISFNHDHKTQTG